MENKIHIWIGRVSYSEKEYWDYFDDSQSFILDENGFERNKNEIIISKFADDIGMEYDYNPDFIGFYFDKENKNLDVLLQEQPALKIIDKIKSDCHQVGIKKANAMFYYIDKDLIIKDKEKLYNGMKYIGCYSWEYSFDDTDDDDDEEVTIDNFWNDW